MEETAKKSRSGGRGGTWGEVRQSPPVHRGPNGPRPTTNTGIDDDEAAGRKYIAGVLRARRRRVDRLRVSSEPKPLRASSSAAVCSEFFKSGSTCVGSGLSKQIPQSWYPYPADTIVFLNNFLFKNSVGATATFWLLSAPPAKPPCTFTKTRGAFRPTRPPPHPPPTPGRVLALGTAQARLDWLSKAKGHMRAL